MDIDITQDLKYEVLVERKGYAFFVEFEYENLPDFCGYCKTIGHNASFCRKRKTEFDRQDGNPKNDAAKEKEVGKHPANVQQQKQRWTNKHKEVVDLDIEEGTRNNEVNNTSPLIIEAAACAHENKEVAAASEKEN